MRAEPFAEAELSCNDFLGGRARLLQPAKGYRAGIDPVLLAAIVPVQPPESVLDLGCGAGAALMCLAARVPGLRLYGVELQPAYADLARRNAALNAVEATVVCADLGDLPDTVRQQSFDHVMANPPYFEPTGRTQAADRGRETGLAEDLALDRWVQVAARRTAPGGTVTFVQRVERLPDLVAAFSASLGSVQVLPLSPRKGRDPKLVLVRGRKGGRAAFRLHEPLVLHSGDVHASDGDDYTTQVSAVLRDGAALTFG